MMEERNINKTAFGFLIPVVVVGNLITVALLLRGRDFGHKRGAAIRDDSADAANGLLTFLTAHPEHSGAREHGGRIGVRRRQTNDPTSRNPS